MSDDECMICCEKYNKSLKSKVCCNNLECNFAACKTCTRQYLMNTSNDIHCMQCRKAWDQSFVILNLNRSWFINTYRPRRTQLLFERNISKTQEAMPEVEEYMEKKRIKEKNKPIIESLLEDESLIFERKLKLRKEMNKKQDIIREEYHKKMKSISNEYADNFQEMRVDIQRIQDRVSILKSECGIVNKEKNKFIMPCQRNDCQGFLSTGYKCGLCSQYTCSKCLEVLGDSKDVEHVCNEDTIKTAELIKTTTKPCPDCGQRIHKTSGCNQMWCIDCKCAFDWVTGKKENGTIHNPHYFQFLRNNTNGAIPRQPGDDPCADYGPYLNDCNTMILEHILDKDEELPTNDKIKYEICVWGDILFNIIQLIHHIQHVDMRQTITWRDRCENTREELVHFITKEINDTLFKCNLEEKDKKRQKYNDYLYIYDLIVNVGKDIVKGIFKKLTNNDMFMSRAELKKYFKDNNYTNDYIHSIYKEVRFELKRFIQYCNEQFQIVSVSHNCNVPQIKLKIYGTSILLRGGRNTFDSKKYHIIQTKAKIKDIKNIVNNEKEAK